MKDRIITAIKLGKTARQSGRYNKDKKAYKKIYWVYIWQCLINSEIIFFVSFNRERKPGVYKIVTPSKDKLDWFLKTCGLEVKSAYLDSERISYGIGKI